MLSVKVWCKEKHLSLARDLVGDPAEPLEQAFIRAFALVGSALTPNHFKVNIQRFDNIAKRVPTLEVEVTGGRDLYITAPKILPCASWHLLEWLDDWHQREVRSRPPIVLHPESTFQVCLVTKGKNAGLQTSMLTRAITCSWNIPGITEGSVLSRP